MPDIGLGTISITNGEDSATVTGGALLQMPVGSTLFITVGSSIKMAVLKASSSNSLTLADPWPHATVENAEYSVAPSLLGVYRAADAIVAALDMLRSGEFALGARLFFSGTEHLRVDENGLYMDGPFYGPGVTDPNTPDSSHASSLLTKARFDPVTLTSGDNLLGNPIFGEDDLVIGRNLLPDYKVYRVSSSNPVPGLPVDFTGTGTVVVFNRSLSNQVQMLVRHTSTENAQMWIRSTVADNIDGVAAGTWVRLFTSANIIGQITKIGGVLTGGFMEFGGSDASNSFIRFANGWQIVRMLVNVDITNESSSQTFNYPANFASNSSLAVSHAALIPNAALHYNNIRAIGFGTIAGIRLTTAGTGASPGAPTDQLRLVCQGYAAGMSPF